MYLSYHEFKHKEIYRYFPIPVHGKSEIGGWLFYEILDQLGITEEEFDDLR